MLLIFTARRSKRATKRGRDSVERFCNLTKVIQLFIDLIQYRLSTTFGDSLNHKNVVYKIPSQTSC